MFIQSKTYELKDGRLLGFAEYGDKQGYPIIFCHGTPNSRLIHHPDQSILEKLNIRLINIERPGYGLSDAVANRSVLEWSEDVQEFIDNEGIAHFSIVGVSGGVPYALACAYKLVNMVESCGIISGFAPIDQNKHLTKNMSGSNKIGFWMAKHSPWMLKVFLNQMANSSTKNSEKQLDQFMRGFSIKDQKMVDQFGVREVFLKDMKEAYRQGEEGHFTDLRTLVKPWGFSLEDIETKVYIWQGDEDKNVPVEMGQVFHEKLPHATSNFIEGEGHLLYLSHWEEILKQITIQGEGAK